MKPMKYLPSMNRPIFLSKEAQEAATKCKAAMKRGLASYSNLVVRKIPNEGVVIITRNPESYSRISVNLYNFDGKESEKFEIAIKNSFKSSSNETESQAQPLFKGEICNYIDHNRNVYMEANKPIIRNGTQLDWIEGSEIKPTIIKRAGDILTKFVKALDEQPKP